MVFSSVTFLFAFLPVAVLLFYAAPGRARQYLLLLLSLLFYSWGSGGQLLLLLISITVNYFSGLALAVSRGTGQRKVILSIGIAANLALLGYYKYLNFIVDSLNALLSRVGMPLLESTSVELPIGISFFTFQALSYLIDLYRGQVAVQRNPFHLALYIALFPQLVAGPIVRYQAIADQIAHHRPTMAKFTSGVGRFIIGLGKKCIIANGLGAAADKVFALDPAGVPASVAWLGALCYGFQIYFDFSGYSCMAIGLGRMFGYEFAENFSYPYISRSFTEFWRRWHISLSSWFRDYLYIPLGGNRCGTLRTYANLFIVFLLCGLWHGAAWNFIFWGLLHGLLLISERLVGGRMLGRAPVLFRHLWVVSALLFSWVLFRAESLNQAGRYMLSMLGLSSPETPSIEWGWIMDSELALLLMLATLGSTPLMREALEALRKLSHAAVSATVEALALWSIFSWSLLRLAGSSYNPFIYFRF